MGGPGAEGFHFMETAVDEEFLRVAFGHYLIRRGAHAAVTARPIHEHELPAGLQYPLHLGEERVPVLHLEKRVGEDEGVERRVAQMRAARLLNVAPDRLNDARMPFMHIELQVLEDVFLDVYRVHLPAMADDGRRRASVVATAGPEVADLHALAQA